jgi:hypothetical protein
LDITFGTRYQIGVLSKNVNEAFSKVNPQFRFHSLKELVLGIYPHYSNLGFMKDIFIDSFKKNENKKKLT